MSNNLKQCLHCGKSFPPTSNNQKYCCDNCRDTMKQRKYRLQRKLEGKCPQCGKKMDYPVSRWKTKNKISYCNKCREYFKKHREKKLENNG